MNLLTICTLVFSSVFLFSCKQSSEESKNQPVQNQEKEKPLKIEVEKVRIYAGTPGVSNHPLSIWAKGDAKPDGVEPRLIEYILNQLNLEYEYVVDFQYDGKSDERLDAIQLGQADIAINGITITDERKDDFLFSDPYFTDGVGVIVDEGSDYVNLEDLKGKKIFVYRFSTTYDWVVENLKDCEIISQEDLSNSISPFKLVKSGRVDAYLSDYSGLQKAAKHMGGLRLFQERFTEDQFGIAINKECPNLQKAINQVLHKMKASGRLQDFVLPLEQ